jgi:uncharacterized repeat protein (TIGR02543 family)
MLAGGAVAKDYSIDLSGIKFIEGKVYDGSKEIDDIKQVMGRVVVKDDKTVYTDGWDYDIEYEYDAPNAKGHPEAASKIFVTIVPSKAGDLKFNQASDRWVAANSGTTVTGGKGVLTLDGNRCDYIQPRGIDTTASFSWVNRTGGVFKYTGSAISPKCGVDFEVYLWDNNKNRDLGSLSCGEIDVTWKNNVNIWAYSASSSWNTAPVINIELKGDAAKNYTGSLAWDFEIDDREVITYDSMRLWLQSTPLTFKFPPVAGDKRTDPAYTAFTGLDGGNKFSASLGWYSTTGWCQTCGVNPGEGFASDGETFIEGHRYYPIVTLTCKPGYRFAFRGFSSGAYNWDTERITNTLPNYDYTITSRGTNVALQREYVAEKGYVYGRYIVAVKSADALEYAKVTEALASIMTLRGLSVSESSVYDTASAGAYMRGLVKALPGWAGAVWTKRNMGNESRYGSYRSGFFNDSITNGNLTGCLRVNVNPAVSGENYGSIRIDARLKHPLMSREFYTYYSDSVPNITITTQRTPAKVSWRVIGDNSAYVYVYGGPRRYSTSPAEVEPNWDVYFSVSPSNGYTLASWSKNVTNQSVCGLNQFCGTVNPGGPGSTANVEITLAPKSTDSVMLYIPFSRYRIESEWDDVKGDYNETKTEIVRVINGGPNGTGTAVLKLNDGDNYGGTRIAKTDIIKMEITPKTPFGEIRELSIYDESQSNKDLRPINYTSGPLTITRQFARDTEIYLYIEEECEGCLTEARVTVNFDPNGGKIKSGPDKLTFVGRGYVDLYNKTLPDKTDLYFAGYTFMGWSATSTATEPDDDIKYQGYDKNTTLYAVWKDNKMLVREAVGKMEDIVTSDQGPLANRVGGFTLMANPQTGSKEWKLELDPQDVTPAFRATPNAASAETFITSVIVKAIQDELREEVGTDEISVTVADGTEDAESSADLNGVAASSVAPVLSSIMTRPNGEKGYEYTYWLKVKRNPFIYVGPYIVWIPVMSPIIPPTPDNLTNDGFIYVDGKRVGTIIFNSAEIAFTPSGKLAIGMPTIQMDNGKSSSNYVVSGITYTPAGGVNTNATVISNVGLSSSASWNTGVNKDRATNGIVVGTYNVSVEVLQKSPLAIVGKSRIVTFTVKPRNIAEASMSLSLTDGERVYNGAAKSPRVTIKDGSYILQPPYGGDKGDYEVTNPTDVGVGSWSVRAVGRGNYFGSTAASFSIVPAELKIDPYVGYKFEKEYDGTVSVDTSVQKLDVKFIGLVEKDASAGLAFGDDYIIKAGTQLKYNSKDVGVNKTVSGVIELTNSETARNYKLTNGNFSIADQVITKGVPRAEYIATTPALSVDAPYQLLYTGKAATVTAAWKSGITNAAVSGIAGKGAITVKYDTEDGKAPIAIGTYNITADVAEGASFKAASGIELGSIVIGEPKKPIIVSVTPDTFYHVTRTLTIGVNAANPKDGKTTGLSYQWYEATDAGNVALKGKTSASITLNSTTVGEVRYVVLVKYKSSEQDTTSILSGLINVEVRSAPVTIKGAAITCGGTYEYNGGKIEPAEGDIQATLGGRSLTAGVDFRVKSVSNNIEAGNGIITVEGINAYKDSEIGTFVIAKKQLTMEDLVVVYGTDYNGQPQPIRVMPKSGMRGLGEITADYSPDDAARVDAGSWQVTLSIKDGDNFTGIESLSLSQPYTIRKALFDETMLSCGYLSKEVAWTGENQGIAEPTLKGVGVHYTGALKVVYKSSTGEELTAAIDSGVYTVTVRIAGDKNFAAYEFDLGTITIHPEGWVSVADAAREIPGKVTVEEAAVTPVKPLSGIITIGPNPVRIGGEVSIYWTGGKSVTGTLSVFNAIGKKVSVIKASGAKKIGTWKVGDVAEGTYLIKGVLTDKGGDKVKVSVLVAVAR